MNFDHVRAAKRIHSCLGDIVIATSNSGLCGLWFDGQKHQPGLDTGLFDRPCDRLINVESQLCAWFSGELKRFNIALDLSAGTSFQQAVWHALLEIPRGQTISYATLSATINRPKASRAVGAAVGRNPVSLIVPCHRVIGSQGALTGYAGGLERKLALLKLESTI
ncbi:MAG: methylated-DNA--[protein]-cysteine S-methyltransferase [Burkholderiaceae bacterium]|jgi:methylated-DNA-[protein]-cysteine S-methyltransferase|nr:methylated-DNA--[protein]-cysteine S-methyltransferase [Betaproteobacteria bacterium]NDE30917.1 methylated-DNA--[protein]-cysteine S-methyltransferase [Betaproteobacteria bacterium]